MVIGSMQVGIASADGSVRKNLAVTFNGKNGVVIPVGAPFLSDAIDLPTKALDELLISIYLPNQTERAGHELFQTVAGIAGDYTSSPTLPSAKLMRAPVIVTTVDVETDKPVKAVVTVGDSITEGIGSTAFAFRSWPDRLAERLAAASAPWTVVNAGISGNRLLRNALGQNALARFDRDVLSVSGVGAVIVMEGINDIGRGAVASNGAPVTVEALIAAQRQLIARGHARGLRMIGATLSPFKGNGYYSPDAESQRQKYNSWIRTGNEFDGVLDFDKALADLTDPIAIDPKYNDRDRLHPNDAGYKAMADFIDLSIITGTSVSGRSSK